MNIFIGMEESQEICKAFRKKGHNAFSCDLKPCSGGLPEYHIKGSVYNYLEAGQLILENGDQIYIHKWDLMILHPVCTCVAVSGNATYAKGKSKYEMRCQAIKEIEALWIKCTKLCSYIVFENPVSVLPTMTNLPNPQYIQPYQFGHTETKKTALFLYNVPRLKPTKIVKKEMDKLLNKEKHRIWYATGMTDKNRAELRSKTFPGIAEAMAEQWDEKTLRKYKPLF